MDMDTDREADSRTCRDEKKRLKKRNIGNLSRATEEEQFDHKDHEKTDQPIHPIPAKPLAHRRFFTILVFLFQLFSLR
jgi:hypothetical protein